MRRLILTAVAAIAAVIAVAPTTAAYADPGVPDVQYCSSWASGGNDLQIKACVLVSRNGNSVTYEGYLRNSGSDAITVTSANLWRVNNGGNGNCLNASEAISAGQTRSWNCTTILISGWTYWASFGKHMVLPIVCIRPISR